LKTPSMSYSDLGEWCKEEFNLDKTPSNAAICQWLKPDKRIELLQLLKTETAPAQLAMKGHYKPENPELEDELYEWFRKHEQRQSVITDDLIRNKALQLGTKRALVDFKASRCWVKKFKERRGIGIKVLHGEAGSADKQWVSVARAVFPTLLRGTDREDVWNGDESGYIYRQFPSRSLATRCRKGMKSAKDRITVMLCCNAAGTHKMDILVIGSAKRPRCFGKTWKQEDDDECQLAIALAESDELIAAEA